MIDALLLSRIQFGFTAMFHFIFVPITLGLSVLIAIMETLYLITKNPIWKEMTKFWGKLFGIIFAVGVCTGLPLSFQFGTNWSYYSHYVGDVFGSILAFEGMMAFFLESTLIAIFFLGWKRVSPKVHLLCTWLLALASSLSSLWILVANGWMQNPVGSAFNTTSLRMELHSLYDIVFNPVAQCKFVHTISAGYVTGAFFVAGISAYYLLKRVHVTHALRSLMLASTFGLAAALSVVVLGDESGYAMTEHQKMKLAAIEGAWTTEEPPASLTILGIPSQKHKRTHYEVKIPWLLGIISTRSLTTPVLGIDALVHRAEQRIHSGLIALSARNILKEDPHNTDAQHLFSCHHKDLGHALLLYKYTDTPLSASQNLIQKAAESTIPHVPSLFWAFRFMVFLGLSFIIIFGYMVYIVHWKQPLEQKRFLRLVMWMTPAPIIASQLGWFVSEYGRQPWAIDSVLPTFLAHSPGLSLSSVAWSLGIFVVLYTGIFFFSVRALRSVICKGPR